MVLTALQGPPFEPLESADLQHLPLKTALLLALVLVKQVGDLQALTVSLSLDQQIAKSSLIQDTFMCLKCT